jgi:hypothetical protein
MMIEKHQLMVVCVGALVATRRGAMPDIKGECTELLAGHPAGAGQ